MNTFVTTTHLPALLALAALTLPAQAKDATPKPLSVAAADRPADAKALDASRKPAETLALLI